MGRLSERNLTPEEEATIRKRLEEIAEERKAMLSERLGEEEGSGVGKYTSINEFEESLDNFITSFKKSQDEYLTSLNNFKKHIILNKGDIKIITHLLKHINNIYENNNIEDDGTLNKVSDLIKTIYKNNKTKTLKNKYLHSKQSMDNYLNIVKKINGFNMGSMCICCMTNYVNVCLNPCGHTFCDKCLKTVQNSNNDFNCIICRKKVTNIIKMFNM